MTVLYSNGCSYTANLVLESDFRYPQILSKKIGWDLQASAIPGSCNRRIIRCTIRDCIKLLEKQKPIFALIQLSHMARTEFAGTKTRQNQWKYADSDFFESINGPDCPELQGIEKDWGRNSFLLHDEQAEFTRLASDIITLTAFFKLHKIDYLIYSGPKIQLTPENIESDTLYRYLLKDKNVLDLLKFNMLDLTGQQKHPDIIGMQLIADYFFNLLCEQV
jgi:hypothetical protein